MHRTNSQHACGLVADNTDCFTGKGGKDGILQKANHHVFSHHSFHFFFVLFSNLLSYFRISIHHVELMISRLFLYLLVISTRYSVTHHMMMFDSTEPVLCILCTHMRESVWGGKQ
jgi:hypothetical protein